MVPQRLYFFNLMLNEQGHWRCSILMVWVNFVNGWVRMDKVTGEIMVYEFNILKMDMWWTWWDELFKKFEPHSGRSRWWWKKFKLKRVASSRVYGSVDDDIHCPPRSERARISYNILQIWYHVNRYNRK